MNYAVDVDILLSVELGPGRTGLAGTLGYTILDGTGAVKEARTTTGIYELSGAPGTYAVKRQFLSTSYTTNFVGHVVWDTGESDATKKTAITHEISTRRVTIAVGSTATSSSSGVSSISWVRGS